jgi:aminopeptidase N
MMSAKNKLATRRLGYVAGGLSVVLCVSGAGAAVATGPSATHSSSLVTQTKFTPGSPGLGDPYFPREGNGGYDVSHYNLDLTYLPHTHHLGGVVTVSATATQNLSRFDLDFKNFKVGHVLVNGARAEFRRRNQELIITPAKGLPKGKPFTVVVSYAGTPHTVLHSPIVFGAPYGWIYTNDGAFVGCEPNAASTWFPSNDHPSDKASFTFHITVPQGTKVMANGTLADESASHGMSTFVWREKQPMATYLATIDIGKWRFHKTTTAAGIPEFVGVDPSLEGQAEASHIVRLSGDITDYWSKMFGPYAFSSTGAIIDNVPNVGFSLETETRPLYGFVPGAGTASHELAHQWFGDSVSVASWNNIWLNEGFATFASWLWSEHEGGASTYDQAKSDYDSIPAGDPFWQQSIADPKRDTMFSNAVYDRGGMTLASLRHKIGDDDFFKLLQTWTAQHKYGNATTAQFTALASKISGQNLNGFFKTWLWKQSKPPKI